jgi:hypothetical protein
LNPATRRFPTFGPIALLTLLALLASPCAILGCATQPARPRTAADLPDITNAEPGTVAYDRDVFQTLLGNHEKIRREVRLVAKGVETVTESDNPTIAILIQDHVHAMHGRLVEGRRIRQWDPMFEAVFDRAPQIRLEIEDTPTGVRVREVSDDPKVARLIQAHARVVDGFVARGGAESQLAHPIPEGAAGVVPARGE